MKTLGLLALAGFLSLNSCDKENISFYNQLSNERKIIQNTQFEPEYNLSLNLSHLLVILHSDYSYRYYRDLDYDGYADTTGTGFCWTGELNTFFEEELPPKVFKMEELKKSISFY